MNRPLQYIHIGVGGFGQHWCTAVLPRLSELGLATCWELVFKIDLDKHEKQMYTLCVYDQDGG